MKQASKQNSSTAPGAPIKEKFFYFSGNEWGRVTLESLGGEPIPYNSGHTIRKRSVLPGGAALAFERSFDFPDYKQIDRYTPDFKPVSVPAFIHGFMEILIAEIIESLLEDHDDGARWG